MENNPNPVLELLAVANVAGGLSNGFRLVSTSKVLSKLQFILPSPNLLLLGHSFYHMHPLVHDGLKVPDHCPALPEALLQVVKELTVGLSSLWILLQGPVE